MRLDYLSAELPKLQKYFSENEKVLLALLFGSFGTSAVHEKSDIDIAVLLTEDTTFMEELRISADVSVILSRDDVDLVVLNRVRVNIAHRALATGEIIFNRNPEATADFVEKTINHYLDFGLKLREIDHDFDEGLREEYLNGK